MAVTGFSLLLGLGCAEDASTQVVVLMDTDYATPLEVDRIRARVSKLMETETGPEERQTWVREFAVTKEEADAPSAYRLPATFGILPGDGDLERDVIVELEALENGGEDVLVSRRAKIRFVAGDTRLLRMHLYRGCAALSCVAGETCGCADVTSCSALSCIDETVRPQDLEPIDDPRSLPEDAGTPTLDASTPDSGVAPSDGGAEPDASLPDGGGINCEPPLSVCGLDCVSTQTDPRYCGDCDTACSAGQACAAGRCLDPGDCRANGVGCAGFSYCDEATGECLPGCADSSQCTAPPNSIPVCSVGACGFICNERFGRCDEACCPTSCPPGQALYENTCAEVHLQTADDRGNVGEFTSIALDATGSARIACYASSERDVRYLTQQADASWVSETPDGPNDVGRYASTAIAPDGVAHIAYYDSSDKALMFATRQADESWVVELVDEGDVGEHGSLAFDAAGSAHVSYYDRDEKDLKYATRTRRGVWTIERVDAKADVGQHTSLAVGTDGLVHVSYYDASDRNLKYALREGDGTWVLRTVSSDGNVGKETSLALDASGVPHIIFYDESNKDLLFARQIEDAWSVTIIDSVGNVGKDGSLVFGADGAARVSYYDESNRDLKFAIQLPDDSWSIQTLDSMDDVGRHTSIAVDNLGNAHISYRDATNESVKYALIAAPE